MLDEEEEINSSSNKPTSQFQMGSLMFELSIVISSKGTYLDGVSLCLYCLGTFHSQNVWQESFSLSQVTSLAWARDP